ncbi:hypothetical protein DL769_000871 [Monosporascus sp. CRB-8-3]|nr:hypothetical protein DL769_000871 [Monosporascus sp. CRB-8-3]
MAQLKVLISGAGIAGNSLAFWLSKLGHNVTVVERFPSLRATGLQVDLRGHGIEVLRRMGLEKAFRALAAPEQGIQIVDSSGRRRAYFPANNKSGQGQQSFTSDFEIMRGDLCRLLYDATKDRTKYVFGTSVENFEEKDGSVEVRFADGKADRFDLLVGADGQWSRTRKIMLGPGAADCVYPLGLYTAYFNIPRPIQEGEEYIATVYIAPGKRGIMTRRHSPHEIQAYVGCKTESERLENARPGDVKEEKEALAEILKGAGWETEEILKSMKDAEDFYLERMSVVRLESWSRGRVALVGDAAYCPSATTGMGTTCAVVGAYVLTGEIGRYCGRDSAAGGITKDGLATALEAYRRNFEPFMQQVQKGIEARDLFPSSAWTISIMHVLVGLASFLRVDFGKYITRENIKGWGLPQYDVMLRG